MKNISVLIVGLSLFLFSITGICNSATDSQAGVQSDNPPANALSIMSSPELNSLATNWANEYGKLNPTVKISISEFTKDQALVPGQLNLITNDYSEALKVESNWKMVIGRDAIVAIYNAKNPMLNEITRQGVTSDELARIISNPEKRNWESMIHGGQNTPIHCYITDNEKVKETIAKFTAANPTTFNEATMGSAEEVIASVQKEVYAVGFCKLTDVCDANTNDLIQGILLLPVDKNKNGRIDSFENIYSNIESFTRGVWIGKYPHALCGNIFAVASSQPTDKNTLAFLTWAITDGQKYLNENGYSDLASTEIKSNMELLAGKVDYVTITNAPVNAKSFISTTWMIVLVFLAITAFLAIAVIRYGRKQKWSDAENERETSLALNEESILAPKGIYFDKTHTWAFMEKDGNVKVGIDDFLQHVTGTLTRIIMKEPGERIRKGEKILTIVREGKQLNIYAPISGIIKQQNTSLLSDSSLINSSPFTEGWVYLIEPNNWLREIRFLFMGERYKEWIEDEFARLKDFYAVSVRSKSAVYPQIILQDGGEITDHVLADLEPAVWEEFQIKFINASK